MVKEFISQTAMMTKRMKWLVLCFLYKQLVNEEGGSQLATFVVFLDVSPGAMQTFLGEKKHKHVYDLSMCFKRGDNAVETQMPLDRMPFGLIDYNIWYFAAHSSQKLGMEEYYG